MALTRTSIENYTVAHLVDASLHWNTSAQQWETHFEAVNQQANMVTFLGPAADGMRLRTGGDHATVITLSEQLRTAAHTATMGASELEALHRGAMSSIQAAEDNNFVVGEDLSVQDRTSAYLSPVEAAERQAQAKAHAASIGTAAVALHTHDTAVAGAIEAHSATLATSQFADGKPIHGGIQAVDRVFKRDMYGDPVPPDEPPPPGKVWTWTQDDPLTHQGHWQPGEPLHDCSGFHEGAGVAAIVGSTGAIVLNPILGTLGVLGPDGLAIDDIGQCK